MVNDNYLATKNILINTKLIPYFLPLPYCLVYMY